MKADSSKDNLCDTCRNHIATCEAENIEFGDGVGNDNVTNCDSYVVEES
jgi:hypothetical protein